jgi:hypothetical protein
MDSERRSFGGGAERGIPMRRRNARSTIRNLPGGSRLCRDRNRPYVPYHTPGIVELKAGVVNGEKK